MTVSLFVISVPILCWAVEVGVALTASHLLAFALVGVAAAAWWRGDLRIPRDLAVASLVVFVAVAAITVLRVHLAPDLVAVGESARAKSVKQLAGLVFAVGLFVALYGILRAYGLARSALQTHYWVTVAIAVIALLQSGVALIDIHSALADFPVHNSTLGVTRALSLMYGFPRVSATLVEPSHLATYLLTGWAFWLWATEPSDLRAGRVKRVFALSGVLVGTAVIVAGSRRGDAIFLALAAVTLLLRSGRAYRAGLVGLSLVAGIALTGPAQARGLVVTLWPNRKAPVSQRAVASPAGAPRQLPAPPDTKAPVSQRAVALPAGATPRQLPAPPDTKAPVSQRAVASPAGATPGQLPAPPDTWMPAATDFDLSVQHRLASYLVALRVFREHPLLGAGFGTSAFYMEKYWPASFSRLPPGRVAPAAMLSQYAALTAETGLLGLLCLLGLTVDVFGHLVKAWRDHPSERNVVLGMAASLFVYVLASASVSLLIYQILLVWLLLAISLALGASFETPSPARIATTESAVRTTRATAS